MPDLVVPEHLLVPSPAFWLRIPAAEYHADKTRVNSSSLKTMLKSPLSFHNAFYGRKEKRTSEAMRLGSLFHSAVELYSRGIPFEDEHVVMPGFSGKTKDGRDSTRSSEAKAAQAEWVANLPAGKTVIDAEDLSRIQGMMKSLMGHPDARNLFRQGHAEMSGFYNDPATGIRCRIRPDYFHEKANVLIDIKTVTDDCRSEAFSRAIWEYRYDLQMSMYAEGIEQITGEKPRFCVFLVIEREPPYEVAVYKTSDILMLKGSMDYHLALNSLKQSIESNQWLGYQQKYSEICLPPWAAKEI